MYGVLADACYVRGRAVSAGGNVALWVATACRPSIKTSTFTGRRILVPLLANILSYLGERHAVALAFVGVVAELRLSQGLVELDA